MLRRVRAMALVAALVLAAACTAGGDRPEPGAERPPAARDTTTTTSTTDAPSAEAGSEQDPTGELVVIERGFSLFPDPVDPRGELGSFAVVVVNTDAELLASGVTVISRLLDAAGNELVSDTTLLNGVQPGATMAVGRSLVEPIDQPQSLEVDVEVAAWLVPADPAGGVVAAEAVTTDDEAGGLVTEFEVWSAWPADEEGVDVTALYRGADGRILGAEMTTLDRVPAGGSAQGLIRVLAPIPDLVTTEVLVSRGFAAHTSG